MIFFVILLNFRLWESLRESEVWVGTGERRESFYRFLRRRICSRIFVKLGIKS
jgi:hypothetical protein